ncbi:MAG TPA: cytochrome c [bacterium]|jgi:cytochrome c556
MDVRRIATALLLLGAICLLPLAASAQSDEAYIKYRQKVMGSLGQNMGGIGDILKEKLPLQENIPAHAAAISESAKAIAAAFKHKVTEGKTDALPGIWSDLKDFAAKADDASKEAAKLAEVARGGNMEAIGAQVKKLGGTCGACHKEYRKKKEDSYKSKM